MKHLGKEYLKRIYQLSGENVHDEVIQNVLDHTEKGVLMRSEYLSNFFCAVLFELSDKEKKMVEELEKERNVKICHVILRHTIESGDEYAFILTPSSEEDLEYAIRTGYHRGIVANNFVTETGDIGLTSKMGGFVRTW